MEVVVLHAEDISCDHCARTIKRELADVPGVEVVEVDVPLKTVTLRYADHAALERAKAVLHEIGYPATERPLQPS